MPATNATTKKPTTRASTTTKSASSSPAVQTAVKSQQATKTAGTAANPATQQGTGIFNWQLPNIMPSLDQFLGLPTVIDWQDIAIRSGLVVVGIILLFIVAWGFVHGKQQTNVQVQAPPPHQTIKAAEMAAEVA